MTGASRAQPGDRPCVPEESAGTCRVCHLVQTIRTKISHGTEYSRKIIKPNNNRLQQTIYQQRTKPHTTSSEKQCIHIHSSLHVGYFTRPPPTRDPSQRPFQKVVIFFFFRVSLLHVWGVACGLILLHTITTYYYYILIVCCNITTYYYSY